MVELQLVAGLSVLGKKCLLFVLLLAGCNAGTAGTAETATMLMRPTSSPSALSSHLTFATSESKIGVISTPGTSPLDFIEISQTATLPPLLSESPFESTLSGSGFGSGDEQTSLLSHSITSFVTSLSASLSVFNRPSSVWRTDATTSVPRPTHPLASPVSSTVFGGLPTFLQSSVDVLSSTAVGVAATSSVPLQSSDLFFPSPVPSSLSPPLPYEICNENSVTDSCTCFGCRQRRDFPCCLDLFQEAVDSGVNVGFSNLTIEDDYDAFEMPFKDAVGEVVNDFCAMNQNSACNLTFTRRDIVVFLLEELAGVLQPGIIISLLARLPVDGSGFEAENSQRIQKREGSLNNSYLSADFLASALQASETRLAAKTGYPILSNSIRPYSEKATPTVPDKKDTDRNLIIVGVVCGFVGLICAVFILAYACYQWKKKVGHYNMKITKENPAENEIELKEIKKEDEDSGHPNGSSNHQTTDRPSRRLPIVIRQPFVPDGNDGTDLENVASNRNSASSIMSPAVLVERMPSLRGAGIRRLPAVPEQPPVPVRMTQRQRISQILGLSKVTAVNPESRDTASYPQGHPSSVRTQELPLPMPILTPHSKSHQWLPVKQSAVIQAPELLVRPSRQLPELPPVRGANAAVAV